MPETISKTKYTSQYVDNMSFDDVTKTKITEIADENGNIITPATEETLQAVLAASGGSLPYDTIDVNTTNPSAIVVTKKNGVTVVDTKTINII